MSWNQRRLPRPTLWAIHIDAHDRVTVGGLGMLARLANGTWTAKQLLGTHRIFAIDSADDAVWAVGCDRVMVAKGKAGFVAREQRVVPATYFHYHDVRVFDDGRVFLVGDGAANDGYFTGTLISSDKGATFRRLAMSAKSLSRGNDDTLYALTDEGALLRWNQTEWSPCGGSIPTPREGRTALWAQGDLVIAVSSEGLYRSTDGAATFAQIETRARHGEIERDGYAARGTLAHHAGELVITGPAGDVARSDDVGATWRRDAALSVKTRFEGIAFDSKGELWGVNNDGWLLTTAKKPPAFPRDLIMPLSGYKW
jgi:photosystem II stability/assembly factor-like uncharacterized protein